MFVVNVGFRVADACISPSSVFSLVVKFSRTLPTVRFVCTELLYWTEPLPMLDWCFLHIPRKQCSWLIRSNPSIFFSSGRAVRRSKFEKTSLCNWDFMIIYDHFSVSGGQSMDAIRNFNLHLVLIELGRWKWLLHLLRIAPMISVPPFDWNM